MNKSQALPKSAFRNPIHFLAIGLGSGAAPKAPGTWGTVMGVLLYLPLSQLTSTQYAFMLLVTTVFGIYVCEKTSKDWGVHDHGGIVWDEFVGYWITMWLMPVTLLNILLGFALFRFFDIVKPWPIRWVDKKVGGGFGIMLDDILAGVMAWLCLYALQGIV